MKIIVTQTKQVRPYEPRKIEVHIDTQEENLEGDWEDFVKTIAESLDRILYPERYDQTEEQNDDTIIDF
ncbi:hypothetical protein [Crocosphaera sp.]|uniref:hypothetical protein n=1 Tax=Crocosphaera sp. TaxID=2729996 RepID=UPI003F268861|nr:hypothetical protein [Crocosphaera sp.]